jgi:ATP-dependent helicase Lhr and Lhr-like helicase
MADSVLASLPGAAASTATSSPQAPWLTAGSRTGPVTMPADLWAAPGAGPPSWQARPEPAVVVLAAADPANAYGAALPWPPRPDETAGGHRPGRKAGALVILIAGQLVLYVERGGKTLLSWTSDPAQLGPATAALAGAVRAGALGRLTVERADGGAVYDSPLAQALEAAGFRPTPRGLRLRG